MFPMKNRKSKKDKRTSNIVNIVWTNESQKIVLDMDSCNHIIKTIRKTVAKKIVMVVTPLCLVCEALPLWLSPP